MSRKAAATFVMVLVLAMAGLASADPAPIEPQLRGLWQGELRSGKDKALRIILKVWREGPNLLARVYSPDQDDREYIVEFIRLKERRIELELQLISAVYAGTMNGDGSEISGTWTQRGIRAPLVFRRVSSP